MKKITTSKAEIVLLKEGFVRINIADGVHLEEEDTRAIHEAKLRLIKPGDKHVVLLDSGKFSTISKEARELSARAEITDNRLAKAMVVHSLAQKLIGGFFIKKDKPTGRTRMFVSETKAIRWLNGFLK